jgi:hypothetical protein
MRCTLAIATLASLLLWWGIIALTLRLV